MIMEHHEDEILSSIRKRCIADEDWRDHKLLKKENTIFGFSIAVDIQKNAIKKQIFGT